MDELLAERRFGFASWGFEDEEEDEADYAAEWEVDVETPAPRDICGPATEAMPKTAPNNP